MFPYIILQFNLPSTFSRLHCVGQHTSILPPEDFQPKRNVLELHISQIDCTHPHLFWKARNTVSVADHFWNLHFHFQMNSIRVYSDAVLQLFSENSMCSRQSRNLHPPHCCTNHGQFPLKYEGAVHWSSCFSSHLTYSVSCEFLDTYKLTNLCVFRQMIYASFHCWIIYYSVFLFCRCYVFGQWLYLL